MPRTKQIHPRNLRDKIEEAQKELNGAEVSKKGILEAGVKGASESLKGVKRKKIVTENHLKKIPKSPLRNPLQAKHKQNTEDSSFAVPQSASESHRRHGYSPAKTGKQFAKQNGETPGITAEASKSEDSVSPKKSLFLQHPAELRRWRSEGSDPAGISVLHDNLALPGKSRTDNIECIPPHGSIVSPSPPLYTNTAFDVLLKAMEPELSTLSQKGSSCAIKTEKLRPNKTVRSPSKLKNPSVDALTQPAKDLVAESQKLLPCTSSTVQKNEQASVQPVSHSANPHEHLVSTPNQQNQQLPCHAGFTASLANLRTQEITRLEQVYDTAVMSTTGLTSPSNRTQVSPPNQQVDSASPLSISPANSTQSPPMPINNSTRVASVVNQSVEQMCNLLLRDQKPKKQGKYICEYCNRACAKPSVLLKHIRSHTGERPYPCVTCGFSFKTKSNLYKHKKSHAHTIKLGLVLQPDAGGLFLSQESPKALGVPSDVEDSGESEEEGAADGRLNEPGAMELRPGQITKKTSHSEALLKPGSISGNSDHVAGDFSPQEGSSESQGLSELPKMLVHPVSVSPLRTDCPKAINPKPELPNAQRQKDLQVTSILAHPANVSSLETEEKSHQRGDPSQPEGKPDCHGGTVHAQLQRQQATDYSQEQQGKLLSPRSLGSTDSGYFSRSESADQAVSPPTPFARTFPPTEPDSTKNNGTPAPRISAPAPLAVQPGEKPLPLAGQMPPPLATKTLEERISKLISDNEALVDDKQLDSVKPRRTSLSRRGSIDSPKSYIFKDSFQFDLKPMGRRTSSSSDIPKSPFTPTEKSKQVFLLSVPSLDCLPITRSNSMPTTGYSAVPANIIPPPHPLRGSQSFDDKIGAFYDDVFVSGPNTSVPPSGHPRPLVRQAAVEDSSVNENHVLGPGQSVDEGHQGCPTAPEPTAARSKAVAPGSHLEKKKSHQGRGTMFECETCRNRYRKLENFENHKKFYCSELHGPKTKVTVREPEQSPVPRGPQPQVLHYRVAGSTGVWEQTPQIRKRRKMKSVGDDEDLQTNESGTSPKGCEALQPQNAPGPTPCSSKHVATVTGEQHGSVQLHTSQVQLVAQGLEQSRDPKLSTILEQPMMSAALDKAELKRQGTGISVIQHTNSLSRPSSFDKSEPFETGSTVPFQELSRAGKSGSLKVRGLSPEECHPSQDTSQPHQPALADTLRGELQEGARKIASERHMLGQPSRLVRQHNIQVPEILVTEEPDRDLDTQCHDEEKSEKFSWPQRSETLSKLPTEKLPPKKKRLRLAEIEHSSTESSFDSTLSRSLSRESSLSHASSFSASLDIEDISKTEATPKVDFPNKAEFLLIPPGSNTLNVPGSHREMRRAASEQINCMPTLMEVSDFRSKSFDCGSMTPAPATLLVESQPSTSPSMAGVTGHVPLLERRRGPLIRQISLNIAPDSHLSPVNLSSFQNLAPPSVNAVPFQGLQLPHTSSSEFPANTQHSQIQAKDQPAHTLHSNSTTIFPLQQLFSINVLNHTHIPLSQQNAQLPLQRCAKEDKTDVHPTIHVSSTSKDCFAPKYQLQCQAFASGQACSSNPIYPLPSQVLPDAAGADQGTTSVALPTKLVDAMSKPGPLSALELGLPGSQMQKAPSSFMLPVHLQSPIPTYCFATLTSLPQILVTQDLSNTSVCQTNQSVMPINEELNSMPESQKDHQNALPNPEKELVCKNVFLEMGQPSSLAESSPLTQKVSVGRLSPQPESSASSKRMLSPANSLDIAMEKHQKRAKDENGAVCATDIISSEPLSSRVSEGSKPKKPVLVRQLCTTEPLEGMISEQDGFSQSETGTGSIHLTEVFPADPLSSGHAKIVIRESTNEVQEFENIKSSTSLSLPDQNSSVPPENTHHISPLKSIDSNQEGVPSGVTSHGDKVSILGQNELPLTTLPLSSTVDAQHLPLPSLKTATSFTWCYLLRQKALPLPQKDQKTSAYTDWTVSSNNPNPLGLPTKVALSLLHSKQKTGKSLYCQAITTHPKSDLLVYSSKWKNNLSKRALGNQKSTIVEFSNKDASEINSEQDKENSLIKSEPRRIKIFDGGYKSNEEYVYVRGRGRGKYICEECGIRCKKPSMLKKHIRTHTDVRPYHCMHCNFSFKTKGNLTKHMKSKAHSKKCVDLGVSVALTDEQDTDESDEKQRFGYERSGCDLEDSDGPDDDDNDNEEDDDDSQAESVLSATPSVTASPQHLPSRSGLQDAGSVDEDLGITECFSGAHTDPMDVLPRALLTKMTVLSTVQSEHSRKTALAAKARPQAAKDEEEMVPSRDASSSPRSPCHQMFVDYSESEVVSSSVAGKAVASAQDMPLVRLSPATVELNSQTTASIASPALLPPGIQDQRLQTALHPPAGLPSPQTHLFSHLPLHSQQQSRTPYNMVPVGGIHVVPAGLTYSTFVPIQAGPVQLTIPAVSVIHRTTSTPGDTTTEVAGTTNPAGVPELSNVVPCFPIGQIRVPGLQNLGTSGLQSLTSLSMETLNIVGLANTTITPQVHSPGLALNAVGLQVLTANPSSQSHPAPPTHIPGLQILNIALPTLIPSVGQVTVDAQGVSEVPPAHSKASETQPKQTPAAASLNQVSRTESPQESPQVQQENAKKVLGPSAPAGDQARLDSSNTTDSEKAAPEESHPKPRPELTPLPGPGTLQKAHGKALVRLSGPHTLSPDRQARRPPAPPSQTPAVHFCDVSSDEDEDRLVIAT
ncbi:zinc finger protein 40 isoform 1-T6 [Thomomys bottae]